MHQAQIICDKGQQLKGFIADKKVKINKIRMNKVCYDQQFTWPHQWSDTWNETLNYNFKSINVRQ